MHFGDIEVGHLDGGGKKPAFVADLLPTRHHIHLPMITAYHVYPLWTLETKRRATRSKSSRWT